MSDEQIEKLCEAVAAARDTTLIQQDHIKRLEAELASARAECMRYKSELKAWEDRAVPE